MAKYDCVYTLILGFDETVAEFLDGGGRGEGDVFGIDEFVVMCLTQNGDEHVWKTGIDGCFG